MDAVAVILREPENLVLDRLGLSAPGDADVVVDVDYSGISTGTERLFWSGRMPPFPGMGYPLVPGYESVGRIALAGAGSQRQIGERVFIPGASCFGEVRGLFGATASRLVVAGARVVPIADDLGERGVLLALAATAHHAIAGATPELIVGHGVLGRLAARMVAALGAPPPIVWERNAERRGGAAGYKVLDPADDPRRDYRLICDLSGDSAILDSLIARLAPSGEVVLAGFYSEPLSFAFPPAFMREARMRVAAQWQPADMAASLRLIESGALSLDGLITHRHAATDAPDAYRTAFTDPACLKIILDWSGCS
ncbi:MAG: chlorophyll synthesis pathway protein BchC [Acetobacteraceae bacterium]|nr:chlorophyll synthesis pathway protein BchC [Acetobacteraceae bacterium]